MSGFGPASLEEGVLSIRNAHLAGGEHPITGIPFKENGFPDFTGVAKVSVEIEQTGNRAADVKAANAAADLQSTPDGYSWHHHENGSTMQLVPRKIHAATGHTGGVAVGQNEEN